MSVAVLMIGDGRDEYHALARASLQEHLPAHDHIIEIDDRDHRLGFAGAIREGWHRVLETDAEFVWHAELDFTFDRPIPLDAMRTVLEDRSYLTQLALLRQPWNEQEHAAGGIAALYAEDLDQVEAGGHAWLEHRRLWTTNPCLYPRWVAELGWPNRRHSEGHFAFNLFGCGPALRAAYWGHGEEWCRHIGHERVGTGY